MSATKLSVDKVLTRLKKMNHGLQTEEEQFRDSWAFSIDKSCNKPYGPLWLNTGPFQICKVFIDYKNIYTNPM